MEVALGIDVGTGSTKAGLVDESGRLVAVGRSAHPPLEPRPGWSEADPAGWLDAATVAVGEAIEQLDTRARVVAIGLSGQMHGVVACGADREPLRPAVLWSDRRSEPDLDRLADAIGDDARARLANPIVAGMAGPTLAALRRLEPDLVDRIRLVLQPKDWLRAQLTGRPIGEVSTDPSDASATLLWDLVADEWSADAATAFGVDPAWLAPVRPSDATAGALTPTAAARLGLDPGIPVAVGAADTASALLGAGVAPGETQLSTGTGGQLARLVIEPVVDRAGRTHLYRSASPEAGWYAMAAIQNAGIAIDWAARLLGADQAEIAAAFAPGSPVGPGSAGVTFLPYLTGERTPHLDATLTGRWIGVRSGTDRSALLRSVYEGVAFALRDGLDALRAAGHVVDRALLAGGGSVAPWWRQLLADALDVPLVPHDAVDASVRGAGLLAWRAIGTAIDPAEAVTRAEPIEPSVDGVDALAPARARFRTAAPAQGPSAASTDRR